MGTLAAFSTEAEARREDICNQASDDVPPETKNRKKKRAKLEPPSSAQQEDAKIAPDVSSSNHTLRSTAEEEREENDGSSSSGSSSKNSEEESASSEKDGSGDDSDVEEKDKERADSTAFGRAFRKIMKKKISDTSFVQAMGPILSAHKQLIAKKVEETATMEKDKIERKREKQAIREKGHLTIEIYPSARDRELMKLATRGVVKLFNAVSKAQSVQESARVSRDSEGKEVVKRSKAAFLASLQSGNKAGPGVTSEKNKTDVSKVFKKLMEKGNHEEQPGWLALRDDFMLGKSRMKDWDKEQAEDGSGEAVESSDDDESLSE